MPATVARGRDLLADTSRFFLASNQVNSGEGLLKEAVQAEDDPLKGRNANPVFQDNLLTM